MMNTSNGGFTLIELMITIVIIGILASIAIATFGDSLIARARSIEVIANFATYEKMKTATYDEGSNANIGFDVASNFFTYDVIYPGLTSSGGGNGNGNGNSNSSNSTHKITICHVPPGNPLNPQIISIDNNSYASHLAHGDVSCDDYAVATAVAKIRIGRNCPTGMGVYTIWKPSGAIRGDIANGTCSIYMGGFIK